MKKNTELLLLFYRATAVHIKAKADIRRRKIVLITDDTPIEPAISIPNLELVARKPLAETTRTPLLGKHSQ
ncbi:hypothetical protein CR161_09125 [Prosthecochloris sp. ZM]|uniref:Uncharacterized protein n=1 Tax=Prosthecochloris aestuarii (strain DSM 271 / SK 413) TaxID=290512 RepID=B4S5X9_PROA2|nr:MULTISPECIES: hypothetical protein [Prosthecochloris]ACF45630.1 hypothetical protein Paes_0574 [Prosthecochloris aestuarii DSM 271]RDD30847.1 hypothetical protein CR161_09125 [Prosthecochloris sp. ZM]